MLSKVSPLPLQNSTSTRSAENGGDDRARRGGFISLWHGFLKLMAAVSHRCHTVAPYLITVFSHRGCWLLRPEFCFCFSYSLGCCEEGCLPTPPSLTHKLGLQLAPECCCCPCLFPSLFPTCSAHYNIPTFRKFNAWISQTFCMLSRDLELNYSGPICCKFKRRNKGVLLMCHTDVRVLIQSINIHDI